jgi:hypothetical protein
MLVESFVSRKYTLGPVFCIRAAGIPFDVLDRLGSPALGDAARRVLATEADVEAAVTAALVELDARPDEARALRPLRKAVIARRAAEGLPAPCASAVMARDAARTVLDAVIDAELLRTHHEVRKHAVELLPDLTLIESAAVLERLDAIAREPVGDRLRSDDRQEDRSFAMYLQRACAKADTVSRFGPSGWGRVTGERLQIDPVPGIAARNVEIERWVVTALVACIGADPAVRGEVCPRLHPDVVVEDLALSDAERAVLARCTGAVPAHAIGEPAVLAQLAERGAIVWALERFAVDASPLGSLLAEVTRWRQEVRARWLPPLERLRDLANELGGAVHARRREIFGAVTSVLAELGIAPRDRGRTLYAAANPIAENCFREYRFELPPRAVERLTTEAAPWFDFFRDAYALATARAFAVYRDVAASAPRRAGRLSYAAFAAHAKQRGLQIENDHAIVQIARETFAEIKRTFSALLEPRATGEEIELTEADCHYLRRQHDLPDAVEVSYPQADVQIAAASAADFDAGRYRWVVAELHQPLMPLQHVLYWSCPDKPALHAAIAAALAHAPFPVRGSLAEQPVHVNGEAIFAAAPQPTFVDRGLAKPSWQTVRPADAEVVVDEAARDVRLRSPAGADLGSLVRTFRVMMGMHPFFPFERVPHAPRLRIGSTVVQRRAWTVTSEELDPRRPSGISAQLVREVARLRRERGLPRWVFARAQGDKLQGEHLFARDKDMKPFYVDLDSVLYLDILERRLRKYGAFELSEMLPSPEELVWSDATGRSVFELRTSVVPA